LQGKEKKKLRENQNVTLPEKGDPPPPPPFPLLKREEEKEEPSPPNEEDTKSRPD